MAFDKSLFGKVDKSKKAFTYYLDKSVDDRLKSLGKKTNLGKSAVLTALVEMFGDIYSDVVDLINNYDGEESGLTLDDYLRENGYGFLVDGKCK